MATEEHVDILLKHGAYKWNQWRVKNLHVIPDFSNADLSGARLIGADLSGANLERANLREAVLSRANLSGARLIGANLSGVNLSGVNLSGADLVDAALSGANLERANLREAVLSGANLSGARLIGANLSGANLERANLREAVLSGANLERANLSRADLSGARLIGANLTGVDLSKAVLSRANIKRTVLIGAKLSGANLSGANLSGARLIGANLSRTKLTAALLIGADLSGADLSGAKLKRANFERANLERANLNEVYFGETYLTSARLGWTTLRKVDLTRAKGLDTIYHKGPSTIGIDTIHQMQGRISERFLRGCGMLPWEIEVARLYDSTLTAIQISDILSVNIFQKRTDGPLFIGGIFISYSRADSKFVDKLYNKLQNSGVSVWLDRHDLVAGPLEEQIGRAMSIQDIVIVVLSENSINSDWVENELEMSRNKEKEECRDVLCPISLDDSWKAKVEGDVLWRQLKRKNVLDFSGWKTKKFIHQFDKLLDGIKVYYGKRMLP